MAEPSQEQKPAGPKFSLFKLSELKGFLWNWFWRVKGFRLLKVGRARVGERQPPVWYELHKTWFPKNRAWFETKLQTVEDFWRNQEKHLGNDLGEDGEPTLRGNPDGIVSFYEELGAYSDMERVGIEVDWFEVGTGYGEENIEYGVPKNIAEWNRFGWKKDYVEKTLKDPNKLKNLPLLKKITLLHDVVYHEGKKELKEELYCFGFTNAKALATRINTYNTRTVDELIAEGGPVAVRTPANQAAAALTALINKIAEIEEATHKELEKLKGKTNTYYTKWSDQVEKLSPEAKNVAVTRYHHTYRIIKQYHYFGRDATGEFGIIEEIAIRNRKVREVDEAGNIGSEITKQYKPRVVIMKLKREKKRDNTIKNIYDEEEEELLQKMDELKRVRDELKNRIERGEMAREEKEAILKLRGYEDRLQMYEQRLDDIEHNILNKNKIIQKTTPNIEENEFWKRTEEIDYGLDENGYPLEINPDTGEVLIDKWWGEIAQNDWQLKTIAKKPGGIDYLKKHLEGFEAEITAPSDKPVGVDDIEIKNRGERNRGRNRKIRVIKDTRFHGHVDLLELGAINYSGWDAFRDDLRDGRYHKHTKSVGDYVIVCEGGFDEEKLAPYPKKMLQLPGGIGTGIGLFIKERYIIPTGPTGINWNVHDRSVLINAKPEMFENVPNEEKSITQDFKMKLPDGTELPGKRTATKYNPAFDRRAENLDYVYWGRMYYYRWSGDINEWDENPFPHISTRGIALYIDYLVKSDVWNYEDAEIALEGHKFDYGVRGATKYGEVNPAKGTGILQEN